MSPFAPTGSQCRDKPGAITRPRPAIWGAQMDSRHYDRHTVTFEEEMRRDRWRRNRRELGRMFRTFFVLSLVAAAAALGASFTEGAGNVALILVAALLAALAAWVGLWLLFVGLIVGYDRVNRADGTEEASSG